MTTLDDVARQLREWRVAAGSPSYSELARRVGALRATEDVDPHHVAPGRVTVYDCFRDGRARIDVGLAVDLATVLGITGAERAAWREHCAEAMRPPPTQGLVTATSTAPAPIEPVVASAADGYDGQRALFAGMGGSGKTQAAARRLARLRAEGAIDAVLTVRVDGAWAEFSDVVHAAAHELAIRLPRDPAQAAGRLLDTLARRRTALLVDDVAHVDQVAPLGAAAGDAHLVATTRRALDVPGFTRIDLPPWSPAQVTDYLTRVIGVERMATDPAAAAALAELTSGLPLVTALVAARVRATPAWSLSDHIAALRERRTEDRIEDAVRTSMDATHAALSPDARALLALLASGPRAGLADHTLRACADTGVDVDASVAELELAFLLDHADARHQLHDIARGYARDRAVDQDPPSVRIARVDRLIDRFCAEAWGVAQVLAPSELEASRFDRRPVAGPSPQAWLTADLPGALELVRSERERRPAAVIELSEAMAISLERTGLQGAAEQLHLAAREAALLADDPVGEARARCALAITALRRDQADLHLDELAALVTRAGDTWTLARLGNIEGIRAMRVGDESAGRRWFHEAHEIARDAGHHALAAAIASNIAIGLAYAGDLDGALRWNADALSGARQTGNVSLAASVLSTMSDTQRMLGRYDDALASAVEAVGFAEEAGDRVALTHALVNRGASLTLVGRPREAIDWLAQAESSAADVGLIEVEATVHTRIGEALLATGDRSGATARFHAALNAGNDSPIDPALALHQLGRMVAEEDPVAAREMLDQALDRLGEGFEQVAAEIRADRDVLAGE